MYPRNSFYYTTHRPYPIKSPNGEAGTKKSGLESQSPAEEVGIYLRLALVFMILGGLGALWLAVH